MKRLVQYECNYILIGVCGYCGGRVASASSIDGPMVLAPKEPSYMMHTPQCRDCGAVPVTLKMAERRAEVRP